MILKLIIFATLLNPMGLKWENRYTYPPQIEGYKYYYGDVRWDPIIYVGLEDLLGLETELQLYFANQKIAKAILILGPAGMNEYNCLEKYNSLIKMMNSKYGKFSYIKETKSSLERDLIFSEKCRPYAVGIKKKAVYWETKDYVIEAILIGDSEGLYIEVTYDHRNRKTNIDKKRKKRILKKISKEIKK